MRALMLTEGSGEWGTGHLNRCLSFAQHLRRRGVEVLWLVRGDAVAEAFLRETHSGIVCDWCAPEVLSERLGGSFLAIMDSYHAPVDAYTLVSQRVPHCVWIDDDGRLPYPAGVVVNPNAPASLVQWCRAHPATRLLTGYEYQSLREEFSDTVARRVSTGVHTVLVMMGGTDPRGLTAGIIAEVRAAYPEARIEAVVPDADGLGALPPTVQRGCILHTRLDGRAVRRLMEAADLAVCAAGQTLCEACRTGLPTIAVCVSENQVRHAEALARAGAIRLAHWRGTTALGGTLPDVLRDSAGEPIRRSLSEAGAGLIDGRGTSRVFAEVLGWSEQLDLRPVRIEDSGAIWEISNHPTVREHSLCKEPIKPAEHATWFAKALTDPALLFLAVVDPRRETRVAGQLRYRIDGDDRARGGTATVSISFEPSIRGRGEAARILREGDVRCFSTFPLVSRIQALIAAANVASQRTFLHAGYVQQDDIRFGGDHRYLSFSKERGNV